MVVVLTPPEHLLVIEVTSEELHEHFKLRSGVVEE